MKIDRLEDSGRRDALPFEAVDGLNLVICPRAVAPTPALLAAARNFGSRQVFHAAGLGADCRDPEVFLWRLMADLRRQLEFSDPIPAEPAAMRETLPNWLARAAAAGGLAIIVQDAHELSLDGLTADLDWLPGWLPRGVAVLISAPPGPAAEQFRERSAAVFTLQDDDSPAGSEPALSDDLLESDAAGPWLELLWTARAGLELEVLDALTQSQLPALDPPPPGLLFDGRRITLASGQARDAVARRRLGDHGRRQALHIRLAEYFGNQPGIAALERACWHWAAAGRLDRLEEILVDTVLLEAMRQPSRCFEALRHWRALGGSDRMHQTLELACLFPDQSSDAILGAAHVFAVGTGSDAPLKWLQRAAERAESEGNSPALVQALQLLAAHGDTAAADAAEMLRRALARVAEEPESDEAVRASLHHRLACLLETEGRETEARHEYELAVACTETVAGADSPRLIPWLINLAAAHKAAGDLGAADQVLRRALRLSREGLGSRHPTTAVCCDQLAGIAYMNGQYDVAEPLYRETLEITEASFGPDHPATAACLGNLGSVLDARQKFGEAEQSHRRSLGLLMAIHGENHEDTAGCMHNLAVALESMSKADEAEQLYRRALETWSQVTGEESPAFATTLLNLAGVLRERGAWGEAEALYRSDIELWRKLLGTDHPHTLGALTELARLYVDGGKPEMAEPLLLHLKDKTMQRSGKSASAYLEVVALLARVYLHFDQRSEARTMIEDALAASEGTLNMLSAPIQRLRKLLAGIQQYPTDTVN
ncbi:MAG: tetratricopeptide repeat protein [Wenzhouxiangellaceae bacterium]|nr:tetratricopeptide repeat protein [Wenzhouxiangellaceae bacterium]